MKKSIIALALIVIMCLCLASCGKDKELTARVDSLEAKVKELEESKLPDSFYGSVYKIDDRSWDALVSFYDANEQCKTDTHDEPYYFVSKNYERGKEYYLRNNAMIIGFKDDSTLTLLVEGVSVDLTYSLMGNDVMVDLVGFMKLSGDILSGEELELAKSMKMNLGTLSKDKTSLAISSEIVDFGVLYLQ